MNANNKTDFDKLIPELKKWNSGKGISIEEWTDCYARYDHFIGYARILWPEFVEHDGCVFLAEGFSPEGYSEWRKRLAKPETEAMINHRHITDLFLNSEFKPNRDVVLYIGRLLKDTWQTKLNRDFPDRKTTVSFPEDFSEDLVQYEISFFQETHETK
jgi:hypothetical protein